MYNIIIIFSLFLTCFLSQDISCSENKENIQISPLYNNQDKNQNLDYLKEIFFLLFFEKSTDLINDINDFLNKEDIKKNDTINLINKYNNNKEDLFFYLYLEAKERGLEKKLYRKLSLFFHPDKNRDKDEYQTILDEYQTILNNINDNYIKVLSDKIQTGINTLYLQSEIINLRNKNNIPRTACTIFAKELFNGAKKEFFNTLLQNPEYIPKGIKQFLGINDNPIKKGNLSMMATRLYFQKYQSHFMSSNNTAKEETQLLEKQLQKSALAQYCNAGN